MVGIRRRADKKVGSGADRKTPGNKKSQVVVNTTTDFFYQAWNPFHLKEIYKGPPPGVQKEGVGGLFYLELGTGFPGVVKIFHDGETPFRRDVATPNQRYEILTY